MPRPSGGFTRLQHAAIKVHDIEAAKDFYVNTLGFTVSEIFEPGTVGDFPFGLCFMRCTELHHDMNLVFWPEGEGPAPPEERSFFSLQTGLHHIAFEVEDRAQLEDWASYLEEKRSKSSGGPPSTAPRTPRATASGARTTRSTSRIPRATASRFSATWPSWTPTRTG